MIPLPVEKRRWRKYGIGSIGCSERRSHHTKTTSTAAATMNAPTTYESPHPRSGPSMILYSSALTPINESTAPNGSSGVAESSLLRGANTATATITTTETTMFTTNTAPHQNDGKIHQPVSRKPAMTGPSAPPAPAKPAQIAIALARSCGGKTAVSNDSVAGITKAAPMPEIALEAMTASEVLANAPTSDPAANTPRPHSNASLRPKRSPIAPAVSNRPAKTIAYESTIHCRSVALAPSDPCIDGRATLRPDTAITTITKLRHRTPSRNQRR